MSELTEEDVFANDQDPLEAIRQIRRDEGVPEDELPGQDEERLAGHATGELPDPLDDSESGPEEIRDADYDEQPQEEEEQPADDEPADKGEDVAKGDDGEAEETPADNQEEEAAAEEGQAKIKTFKANGQEFNFTEDEMLSQFETVFGQAMDYTKKMQKIAPFRKMISAIEDQGLSQDQLNLAIDALKGDKGAIAKILETNNIDSYDLTNDDDERAPYVPSNYGKDDKTLEIEEITGKISSDEEYRITVDVIDEQWDQGSRQMIADNPNMITGLHNDIKSGVYDKVAPVAMKMKVMDGNSKSDIEYYMLAGQKLHAAAAAQQQQNAGPTADELNAKTQDAESKFEAESSEARRKRSASSTGARADRKGVVDYLDDNDEDFDAWYKSIHANM